MTLKKKRSKLLHTVIARMRRLLLKFKLVSIVVLTMIVMQGLKYIYHKLPLELFRISEIGVDDIDLTDAVYHIQHKTIDTSRQIVLINIGCWTDMDKRGKMVALIAKLNALQPKAVGVDLYFTERHSDSAIDEKLNSLLSGNKIVFGINHANRSIFPFYKDQRVNYGYINLPDAEGRTMREYFTHYKIAGEPDIESFSVKLYHTAFGLKPGVPNEPTFMIRYAGTEKGFYNAFQNELADDRLHDFPAIEADILLKDSSANIDIRPLISNKIVIIGWLGSPGMDNINDVTDKHRVPTDFKLVNRVPTMPGTVVHANALQTLINNRFVYKIEGLFMLFILFGVMLFCIWVSERIEENSHIKKQKQNETLIENKKARAKFKAAIYEWLFNLLFTLLLIVLTIMLMRIRIHLNIGEVIIHIILLAEVKRLVSPLWEMMKAKEK